MAILLCCLIGNGQRDTCAAPGCRFYLHISPHVFQSLAHTEKSKAAPFAPGDRGSYLGRVKAYTVVFKCYSHRPTCFSDTDVQSAGSGMLNDISRKLAQSLEQDNLSVLAEWNTLLDAIRNDKPQNNAKSAAYSNIADLMGRAATHSGKIITWDEMMASNFQFCPNIDTMDYDTPPPLQPDADGRYPVPIPGKWTEV